MKENKMAVAPINKLFLKMGLPMIISMVLQALYNVVDSVFVANIHGDGAIANQALTYAFPIQILIIAIGVGTGVGINALLSKSLGEGDFDKVNKTAGCGIFLSLCIYLLFLLFGVFGSRWFISLFTNDIKIINMGTSYLKICTCFSLGSIGYTVYERFLQSTGKTLLSTISQISGAVVNIVLDYVFIFPLDLGVAGAAIATIIGQFVSLFIAMFFHYTKNGEIDGNIKYGIIDTLVTTLIIAILFEVFAKPLSSLFALGSSTSEIINVCTTSLRIASIGFIFMGFSISVQGILQSINYALRPLIISLLRLVIFVFPLVYVFTLSNDVLTLVWFAFPISELLTAIISMFILKSSYNTKIKCIREEKTSNNLIISISREHGTNGKEIGKLVAKMLNIAFYDKEEIKDFAVGNGLASNLMDEELYSNFLSLDVNKEAIINQSKVINEIALLHDAVIIGRASDYILKNNKNLVKIFIYAPVDYRIQNIMKNYNDSYEDAIEQIKKSDSSRSNYYSVITNKV